MFSEIQVNKKIEKKKKEKIRLNDNKLTCLNQKIIENVSAYFTIHGLNNV